MTISPDEIGRIRREVRISDTASRYGLTLKKDGQEFRACCPFHREDTPSFTIFPATKQGGERFYCFGCNENGDVIHFVQRMSGVGFAEACRVLGAAGELKSKHTPVDISTTSYYDGLTALPFGDHPFTIGKNTPLYNPRSGGMSSITPRLVSVYRDAAGQGIGLYMTRNIPKDGKVAKVPAIVRKTAERGWSYYRFDQPYPLHGLDRVGGDKQIVIVEGEKCSDWLQARIGGENIAVVAWPGGAGAAGRVDWSPIAGRRIVTWADHDETGSKAMKVAAAAIKPSDWKVIDTWVTAPDLHEAGWDCADMPEETGCNEVKAYMRSHINGGSQPPASPPPAATPAPPPAPKPPTGLPGQKYGPLTAFKEASQLLTTDKGIARDLITNYVTVLQHSDQWRGVFRLNIFRYEVEVTSPQWNIGSPAREMRDTDVTEVQMWFERTWGKVKGVSLREAIMSAATKQPYDPLLEYVRSLKWDGVKRIDRWLSRYAGVDDTAYTRLVGRKFLISAVARATQPGCKVDTMLILEGEQGVGKSSALASLFGRQWFVDQMPEVTDKDASMQLRGKWGVEFAEMHRVGSARADAVKGFLTVQADQFRPPYGRDIITAPRRCVFAGTINPDGTGYLKDPTGARRFWPVRVTGRADVKAIEADRDQLWAEAMHALGQGEPWWFDQMSDDNLRLVEPEQAARFDGDIWDVLIYDRVGAKDTVTLIEIMTTMAIEAKDLDGKKADRITASMRRLGYLPADKTRRVFKRKAPAK